MSWGRFTASAPVGTSPSRSTVGSPRWGGPSHSGARPGSRRSRPTARSVPVRTPSRSTSCRRRAARSSSTALASRRRLRDEAAEKLAELRRLGERGAQAIERVLAVDHHRAALETAVVVVVTEANSVGTASALVLEQLDRRLGVPAHVRRLLHDLASAPVELKRARYLASTLRITLAMTLLPSSAHARGPGPRAPREPYAACSAASGGAFQQMASTALPSGSRTSAE